MKNTMQAMAINQWGNADVFEQVQMPISKLAAQDILIKVAYAGINPADWKMRAGYLAQAMPNLSFPLVLGLDASGVVVAKGEQVKNFSIGDRIASGTNLFHTGQPGSYAQYMVVNEQRATKIPDSISLISAATLNTAGITAWQALFAEDKGALHNAQGKKVFINGASGGVGSFAVQLAKNAGAEVATTSSTANLAYVESLGSDFLIDYKTQDISEQLTTFAPLGVDFILDLVSANSLTRPLDRLKPGGTMVSIATITEDAGIAESMALAKEQGVQHIYAMVSEAGMKQQLTQLTTLVESGKITLPPTQSYVMHEIAAAHAQMETGHTQGKIVLEITH